MWLPYWTSLKCLRHFNTNIIFLIFTKLGTDLLQNYPRKSSLKTFIHYSQIKGPKQGVSHISVTPFLWSTDIQLAISAYSHVFTMIKSSWHGDSALWNSLALLLLLAATLNIDILELFWMLIIRVMFQLMVPVFTFSSCNIHSFCKPCQSHADILRMKNQRSGEGHDFLSSLPWGWPVLLCRRAIFQKELITQHQKRRGSPINLMILRMSGFR